MSTVAEIEEAASKLSDSDLAHLLEDLRDLAVARAAVAEMRSDEPSVLWSELRRELDSLHG